MISLLVTWAVAGASCHQTAAFTYFRWSSEETGRPENSKHTGISSFPTDFNISFGAIKQSYSEWICIPDFWIVECHTCCVFWTANGCFACHLLVKTIFFGIFSAVIDQHLGVNQRFRVAPKQPETPLCFYLLYCVRLLNHCHLTN